MFTVFPNIYNGDIFLMNGETVEILIPRIIPIKNLIAMAIKYSGII